MTVTDDEMARVGEEVARVVEVVEEVDCAEKDFTFLWQNLDNNSSW